VYFKNATFATLPCKILHANVYGVFIEIGRDFSELFMKEGFFEAVFGYSRYPEI